MKIKVEKVIDLLGEIRNLAEKSNQQGKIVEAVIMPAKTGYWVGRLEDWAEPIEKRFNKANQKLVRDLGEEIKKDDKATGAWKLKPENSDKYLEEKEALLAQEEEWTKGELEWELFEGLNLPASFMGAITFLLKEPQ